MFCVKQHEEYCANHCWIRISGSAPFFFNVSRFNLVEPVGDLWRGDLSSFLCRPLSDC